MTSCFNSEPHFCQMSGCVSRKDERNSVLAGIKSREDGPMCCKAWPILLLEQKNCNVLAISKYLFDQVCLVNLKMAGHCSWILKSFGSGLHKALANSTHLECSKIIT